VELALRSPGLDREEPRPVSNLPNPAHPAWCLRGPECAGAGDMHLSRLVGAAVRGDEVIQARVGLWRMDVGPTPPTGLLLELSAGTEAERWPIDLAQSRALLPIMRDLLGMAGTTLPRIA